MKRKGFTLIELLAVIVILAIIALIATPMIMDVIEKARRGAAEESGNGYIEAVDWYQLQEKLDSSMYQIPVNTIVKINECTTTCLRDVIEVKGDKPRGTEDYIKLNTKGIIETGKLTFGNYEVTIKDGKVESVNKVGETPAEIVFESTLGTGLLPNVAIDSEGTLWGIEFPIGEDGTLQENGTSRNIKIKEDTKFTNVSIGETDYGISILAIDEEENLWSIPVGGSSSLEIGEGTIIKAGTKFQSVSVGSYHTMAIDVEGNLWGWGRNGDGQLGDGTTEDKTEPIQIKEGTKFQSVSVGEAHTMAIDRDGNLWGWGENYFGQLGYETPLNEYGSMNPSLNPTQVKSGTKFRSVSAGDGHTMAIDIEGNLWSWGWNEFGQLGYETPLNEYGKLTSSLNPTKIKAGTRFKSVSAGIYHTIAIDAEGNLWGFGGNNIVTEEPSAIGLLGIGTEIGTENDYKMEPIQIKAGTRFKSVSAGIYHTIAIDAEGNLWIWGMNLLTGEIRLEPVMVMQLQK